MNGSESISVSRLQRPADLLEIAQRRESGRTESSEQVSFKDMFSKELAHDRRLTFSKHAEQRLFSRGIRFSDETLGKIADAVDRAAEKGSRETMILTDESALVVAVNNRTVITAFDRNNLRDGIVTSIDSAVIL